MNAIKWIVKYFALRNEIKQRKKEIIIIEADSQAYREVLFSRGTKDSDIKIIMSKIHNNYRKIESINSQIDFIKKQIGNHFNN